MPHFSDEEPVCDKCGAVLTTGLMAVFCIRREECQFWPEGEEGDSDVDFIRHLRGEKV
jgi:hypothetical protein